jgi:RNA polymerase sigma factor (sigma-70 family)
MDVYAREAKAKRPNGEGRGAGVLLLPRGAPGTLGTKQIGQLLGEWQARELRIARSFRECAGLSAEQLEDLYQETALALLPRRYASEEHLRGALRTGVKHRALNLHRDERRRSEILSQSAGDIRVLAHGHNDADGPERAALSHQDRLIVSEFLCELSGAERRVFALAAEGMGYRAIAAALAIAVNEARGASRTCERKRERFQLLYDTGRLCGFRAATIQALQSGTATSEELAQGAFAHLESCAHCRAEHRTNARRLRRSFQDGAAALLPFPMLAERLGWLGRLGGHVRTLQQRVYPAGLPAGSGGVRERAVELVATGGVTAKLAAGVATVAVIAGGTIGATHVLDQRSPQHRHLTPRSAPAAQAPLAPLADTGAPRPSPSSPQDRPFGPGHAALVAQGSPQPSAGTRREPGGFAFLGVPTGRAVSGVTAQPARAHSATRSSGGPFSP